MPTVKRKVWQFDGISNADELKYRMSFFMLRRTKLDVKLEIPPKTRQIIHLDIPSKFKIQTAYANKSALRKSLDLAADAKIPHAINMVADDLTAGAKTVVATHRIAVAEHMTNALAAKGFDVGLIHSGVSNAKRKAILDRGKHTEDPFALIATIDSTSTSIDLSWASIGTCVELPFSQHTAAQWESRMHRFGQEEPVLIRYLIARGTSDELVLQLILHKIDNFEAVIGKMDDHLRDDLDNQPKGDDALDALFERIVAKQKAEAKTKTRIRGA